MREAGKKTSNPFIRSLIGASLMLAVTAVSVILTGAVISMQDDPLSLIGIGSLASIILSSLVSAVIVSKTAAEGRISVCMLSGILFVCLLLLLGLFTSGGGIDGGVILNALIYLAILFLVSAISSGRKKRVRRH